MMCRCTWNRVASCCAGDYRHDWRVRFTPEPETDSERRDREASVYTAEVVRPAVEAGYR